MTAILEQKLYGRVLTPTERDSIPGGPGAVLNESLTAAAQDLYEIKSSREFAQYVRILEECTKKYTLHPQRKAQAEKLRLALAKKKQAEARKAKKAALAASKVTQQTDRIQSAFNPDMPDFVQFMNGFATPATCATPAASYPVRVTKYPTKASHAAKSTNAGVKKPSRCRKVGKPSITQGPAKASTAQAPGNPTNKTSLGIITTVFISPTDEPWVMEENDFAEFVKDCG